MSSEDELASSPAMPEGAAASERTEQHSTTQAHAIARDPKLFDDWAKFVHLDPTPRATELPDTLRRMLEKSKQIPEWILNPQAPEYEHAQPEFGELIKALSVSTKGRNTVIHDDQLSKHVRSSIVPILAVVRHNALLERSFPTPSEADRRRAMDSLATHVWEYQGEAKFAHRVKCCLQLPITPLSTEMPADQVKQDASVFIILDTDELHGAESEVQSACSSLPTRVRQGSGWSRVLHWVIGYKQQGSGVSQRQVLQGMVSGLYQRRALGFMNHFVFGMAHHSTKSFDVFAATWVTPEGTNQQVVGSLVVPKIIVYNLGKYAMESVRETLELYLLMRDTRALAQTYRQEMGEIDVGRVDTIYRNMGVDDNCIWPPPTSPEESPLDSGPDSRKRPRTIPTDQEHWDGLDVPLRARYVKELLQPHPAFKVHAYLSSTGPGDYELIQEQVIDSDSD